MRTINRFRSAIVPIFGAFEVLMALVAMLTASVFVLERPLTLTTSLLIMIWDVAWLVVFEKGTRNLFGQRRTKWTKWILIGGAIWEAAGSMALLLGTLIDGRTNSPLILLNRWTGGWPLDLIALVGYIVLAVLGLGQLIIHPILVRRARRRMMAQQQGPY